MTEYKTILKMLETNPTDEKVLDEIDARIWCLIGVYDYLYKCPRGQNLYHYSRNGGQPYFRSFNHQPKFSRSLDVLHDAQLEGWTLMNMFMYDGGYTVKLYNCLAQVVVGIGETLAIAYAHAFVQTLEWRAENGK